MNIHACRRKIRYATVAAARDVEVVPAGGVVRGFRHWSHWRPDDSLTLRVVG